ncbi:hypothetical protein L2E82_30787 [Cichorium intybus]|uniref:Uncharacterized protein n=1 Tax=Cichorium intybus TaxID=13427 RepID=A0ACB9D1C4_CICIN|nr:hypothetical protein L2E82_30787 [Cichorium intybus]
MNGGDEANTDRNHKAPAPAIPINPVGHQGSEARRSLDIPIEENGENQGNFNSSGKGGEINNDPVINMTQLTSELPGTEADKTGCNFGPFGHLVPMRCFNPFLSTGGPTLNNYRRAKKRRLYRYSAYGMYYNS